MRSALLTEENCSLCKFNTLSQERNCDSSAASNSSNCSIDNGKSFNTQDEDMLEISEEFYSSNKESLVTVTPSITAN